MRDHIDHTEIASPVTNKFYLEQPHGEIYGLDHSRERWVVVSTIMRSCFTVLQIRPSDGGTTEAGDRYTRTVPDWPGLF